MQGLKESVLGLRGHMAVMKALARPERAHGGPERGVLIPETGNAWPEQALGRPGLDDFVLGEPIPSRTFADPSDSFTPQCPCQGMRGHILRGNISGQKMPALGKMPLIRGSGWEKTSSMLKKPTPGYELLR